MVPKFGYPAAFGLMLLLLGAAVGYVWWNMRRRRRFTTDWQNQQALASVLPERPSGWRHLAPVMAFIALGLMSVVAAKPLTTQQVPDNRSSVMIVLDVSMSMLADDVKPTRLEAAQAVIRGVVQDAPPDLNIGLVTFADNAQLLVPPTQNRELLLAELEGIAPRPDGTRTGEGVMTAIAALDSFAVTGKGTSIAGQVYVVSDGAETPPVHGIRSLSEAVSAVQANGYTVNAAAYGTLAGAYNGVPQPPDFASLEAASQATGGTAVEAPTAAALAEAFNSVPEAVNYIDIEVMDGDLVLILVAVSFVLLVTALVLGVRLGTWFQ